MNILGKAGEFKRQILKNVLILAVVITVFGGGVFFSIFKINASLKTIFNERRDIIARNLSIQSLAALRTESASAQPLLAPLRAKLPSRDELFSFSKKVEDIASARHVQVTFAFGSENSASPDSPASVGFSLSTKSKMADAVAFLADLERASYIMKITSVDLSDEDAKMNGVVFYK